MRLVIKIFVVLLVLGGGGYGIWHYFFAKKDAITVNDLKKYVPDEKVVIKTGDIRKIVNASGKVLPNQDIRLKCKASGQIVEMPYNISDRVKKGEMLVRLDPVDEERNTRKAKVALEVAQTKLRACEISYDVAKQTLETERAKVDSDISSAEVKLGDLKTTLNRAQQLFAKNLVSREELDKAEVACKQGELTLKQAQLKLNDLKTSELSLELKKSDIEQAKAQIETNQIQVQDAQQRLKDTTLLAPIDGVISAVSARVGQVVSSGTSSTTSGTDLLDLTDMSRIFAEINVDESDVAGIREGMPSVISIDSGGERKYDGKVVYITPKGVRSRGVVNFTVRVEILQKESPALRPEMSTNVDIILDQRKGVLVAPLAALHAEDGRFYAQVVQAASEQPQGTTAPAAKGAGVPAGSGTMPAAEITEKREVKLGLSDGSYAEVLSGLKEGDTILISLSSDESRWISKMLDKDNMTKWSTARPAPKK